jgi:hypothetical protein
VPVIPTVFAPIIFEPLLAIIAPILDRLGNEILVVVVRYFIF